MVSLFYFLFVFWWLLEHLLGLCLLGLDGIIWTVVTFCHDYFSGLDWLNFTLLINQVIYKRLFGSLLIHWITLLIVLIYRLAQVLSLVLVLINVLTSFINVWILMLHGFLQLISILHGLCFLENTIFFFSRIFAWKIIVVFISCTKSFRLLSVYGTLKISWSGLCRWLIHCHILGRCLILLKRLVGRCRSGGTTLPIWLGIF